MNVNAIKKIIELIEKKPDLILAFEKGDIIPELKIGRIFVYNNTLVKVTELPKLIDFYSKEKNARYYGTKCFHCATFNAGHCMQKSCIKRKDGKQVYFKTMGMLDFQERFRDWQRNRNKKKS